MENNKGILDGLFAFLNKGWEANEGPTKARCDVYTTQAQEAQNKMNQEGIPIKEKKFYKKERNRALEQLHIADVENKDFIVKVICGVGFACLAFTKAVTTLQKKDGINKIVITDRKWKFDD